MIDTSMVRVHQHAACITDSGNQAVGRSRGGLTSKLHVVVDRNGLLLRLGITAGQAHDNRHCSTLLSGLAPRTALQVMTRPIKLDPNRVPRPLAHLVPVAEKWGDDDDGDHDQAVKSASRSELEALVYCIDEVSDDYLLGWLAGPESFNNNPSPEYVAFYLPKYGD
jgi:transposase